MRGIGLVFTSLWLVCALHFGAQAQTIINEYAKVVNIPACNPCVGNCDVLEVDDASNFSVGDVIMIIQVKGAQVELTADPTFGDILDYGAAGFHEKNTINAIVGNTIYLGTGTAGAYDAGSSLQIVSVPQFPAGYTVPAGGLTCPPWDGNTGGVIALDVVGTLSLSGDIDARGKGLRGAQNPNTNDNEVFCAMKNKGDYYFDLADIQVAGRKGEGIAEWILPAYELGRGKWGNGGGGGHNHNAGGGGGSNIGAGGLGGDEYGGLGCGSVKLLRNGIGGQALDYMGGLRMFFGGGGGAGQENNNRGNSGGDGGGVIIISADDIEGNGHWIRADGNKGINYAGVQDGPGGNDGGGGGGAGGSIKLQINSYGSTPLIVSAEGADGGDLNTTRHGPGGGGGGGLICSSVPSFPANVTVDVSGGQGGITTGDGSNWGTEPGEDGIVNSGCTPPEEPPLSFSVNLGSDVKLCSPPEHTFDSRLDATNNFVWYKDGAVLNGESGPSLTVNGPGVYVIETGAAGCPTVYDTVEVTSDAAAPLNADFCGTNQSVSLGITGPGAYAWYDAPTDGNKIGSGDNFNTPPISADATYYVEDTTVFSYTVGEPASGHGLSGGNGAAGGTQMYMEFEAFDEFTIDAITFAFKAWWVGPTDRFNVTVTITDDNNNPVGSITDNNINPGVTGSIPGPNIVYSRVPIGIRIPATGNYKIQVTSTTQIHWFQNGRQLPYTDPTGEIIRIWSTHPDYMPFFDWQGNLVPANYAPNSIPGFFDWEISAGLACDRVPVNANYDCPMTCTAPSTTPQITPNSLDVCGAVNDSLVVNLEAGFYYQWYLNGTPITGASGIEDTLYVATQAGDYFVRVVDDVNNLADNACYEESNTVTITSNPVVVPSITISEDQNGVCEGSTINFTTAVSNEGTVPAYSWTVNGTDLGITANSISTDTLTDGAVVGVVLTSNADCADPSTATDNVTMQINPIVVPSLDMSPDQNGVCSGTIINFDVSNVQNEGTGPVYAWAVNGLAVGGNVTSISTDTLSDGAVVQVELTSNAPCAVPITTTKSVTVNVGSTVIPVVTIGHDLDTICVGEMVTFMVTDSTGGGTDPSFVWTINGNAVAGDVATISTDTLTVNPSVEVTMTSNSTCASPVSATGNDDIVVLPTVIPTITLTADQNNVCHGTNISFTTVVSGEGIAPTYGWTVNGVDLGEITNSISTDTLSDGAVVEVTVSSSERCAQPVSVADNVTMQLIPILTPDFDMGPDVNGECSGTMVTYTVTNEVNQGLTPTYQWTVNGVPVGGNINSIATDTLSNGAIVAVEVSSSENCLSVASITKDSIQSVIPSSISSVAVEPDQNNVCEGTMITLQITDSTGSTGADFTWEINGVIVQSGSVDQIQTDTLTGTSVVSVTMNTNNVCASPALVSDDTVIALSPLLQPEIIIQESTSNICLGDQVDFMIQSQQNEGATPSYEWFVYDASTGSTNSVGSGTTYSSTVLDDQDSVFVELTSSEMCVTNASVYSNGVVMTVANNVTPSVSVGIPSAICAGQNVDFLATPYFGGNAPSYQWYHIDASAGYTETPIGSNQSTLSLSNLENGDSIYVELTSNAGCIDPLVSNIARSESVEISVNNVPDTPQNLIGDLDLCEGSTGSYQVDAINNANDHIWTIPSIAVQTSGSTTAQIQIDWRSLTGAQYVKVQGENQCGFGLADSIEVQLLPTVTPSIDIVASALSICENENVTFNVDALSNEGTAPLFEWYKVSGAGVRTVVQSQGTVDNYASSTLADGDSVYVILTSNERCVDPATAVSNKLVMQVTSIPNPSISINELSFEICTGDRVTLTSTPMDGGANPSYQWSINGNDVGVNNSVIQIDSLTTNATIALSMVPDYSCWTSGAVAAPVNTTVSVYENPQAIIDGPNSLCFGDAIELTSVNDYPSATYEWQKDGVFVSQSQTITAFESGQYQLTIENPGACIDESPEHRVTAITPRIDAGEDQIIDLGEMVLLEATGNVNSVRWDNDDVVVSSNLAVTYAQPEETTLFTVTGELAGCTTEDTVRIYVQRPIFVPNMFSPNGDDVNDVWVIEGIDDYPNFLLTVFNRWGDKVYFTHDNYDPWNGTRNGKPLPVATYYYLLERDFGDDSPLVGSVTILR